MRKVMLIIMSLGIFAGTAMAGSQWGSAAITDIGKNVPNIQFDFDACKSLIGTWSLSGRGLNTGKTWIIKNNNTASASGSMSVFYRDFYISSQAKITNSAHLNYNNRTVTFFIHERLGVHPQGDFLYSGTMDKSCSLINGRATNQSGNSWNFQLKRVK